MSNLSLNPYIFFRGTCREAMNFYKDIFGGELTVQTYSEVKMGDEDQKDLIMHATLANESMSLMGSDTEKASDKAAKISLSIGGSDEHALRSIFEKLSNGGDVYSELKNEFWGDIFGTVTDKYGIEWMVNITPEDQN